MAQVAPSRRSALLVAAALAFSGMLAGTDFDRFVVGAPAWSALGPEAWAAFSRHADLGRGLVLYPVEAIGAALLMLGAALSLQLETGRSKAANLCLWAATALAGIGLVLTLEAAPVMLSIASETKGASLAAAFDSFVFWSDWRAAAQIASFLAACIATFFVWRRTA